MKDMKGNTTLKVVNPNGGVRRVNEDKTGILVRWIAPRNMEKVDIDYMIGSTTTSIAKGVKAHDKASRKDREKKADRRANGSYLWKNAPVGEGYKIVVTGTMGSTTYTDMSDKAFSIISSSTKKSLGSN
jgi:hypothetical protein